MKLKKIISKLIGKEMKISPDFFNNSKYHYSILYILYEPINFWVEIKRRSPLDFQITNFEIIKEVISKTLYKKLIIFKSFESKNLLFFPWTTIPTLIWYFIFPIQDAFHKICKNGSCLYTEVYEFNFKIDEIYEYLKLHRYTDENLYFKNLCTFLIYLTTFKSLLI